MMSFLIRYLDVIVGRPVRRKFMQSRAGEALDHLKLVCLDLLDDVAASHGAHAVLAIREARHSRDLWDVRSALFRSVALSFGEREARERLAHLDRLLR